MFKESEQIEKFEPKVWLSSPTMHGEEIKYVQEAYETNWMSTVGANINEVERLVCKKIGYFWRDWWYALHWLPCIFLV